MKLVKKEEKAAEKNVNIQNRIAIAILAGLALLGVVIFGIFRDFDAQGYVDSILKQTFAGDVEAAVQMTDETTEEELLMQYEEGIRSFVSSNITSGVEMSEELQEEYIAVCKDIFKSAKFEVKEAEKISGKEYKVPVEYQTVDTFKKFTVAVGEEYARLVQKVDNGEYKGTEEEINAQMQKEFLENTCQLLAIAHKDAEYAQKETMVFSVKKGQDDLFTIDDEQVYELVVKIMGLDEIQD